MSLTRLRSPFRQIRTAAAVTLKTIEILKRNNIKTSLGVSNISFGLPSRDIVNSAFFTMAMQKGLNCAIMNPFSQAMMNSYHSYNVLAGLDEACSDYIAYASALSDTVTAASAPKSTATLKSARYRRYERCGGFSLP